MAVEVFTNDGLGTVTAGGTNAPAPGTSQSLTVTAANAFPVAATSGTPPTSFYVCDPAAETEKMLVTVAPGGTGAGQSWTVTRGADGTTPVLHTGGYTIVQVVTHGSLVTLQRPWLVRPSGDTTGAADPVNVQAILTAYGVAEMAPGTYYGNATVTGHEGQWVNCMPGVIWNLKTTAIPAFQWTPANTASYSITGQGGITGRPFIYGPGGSANPTDGSIAVRMGDIVELKSDFVQFNCQYGLLLSNQYFWTEQGEHRVFSTGCTNPVMLQIAASGGASRTGSFDRTWITVYHNETVSGAFGVGGVQLLAGAQLGEGGLRQYGNFGGTGQASVYALYVSGAPPGGSAGSGDSSILGAELVHGLEYDGTGTKPGTILIASGSFINPAFGVLAYSNMAASSITSGGLWFAGPITGDATLRAALWTTASSGFLSGWSGTVSYRLNEAGDQVIVDWALAIAANTTITSGTTIFTLPSGFYYASDSKQIQGTYSPFGSAPVLTFLTLNTSGAMKWSSATATSPVGGTSFFYGQASYTVAV